MTILKPKDKETKICDVTHPEYDAMEKKWKKFRLTFEGGRDFIDAYLQQFSKREDNTDFNNRKEISYCPAHAKAALIEIKNAIFQRMCDIRRMGGSESYQQAIKGANAGVDLTGNTMNGFIGRIVLPELLSMARVGVFIDKHTFPGIITKAQSKHIRPYLYCYTAEDIRSWSYDSRNILQTILLRNHDFKYHPETGLPIDEVETYMLLIKVLDGVEVKLYDDKGNLTTTTLLNIKEIPFVMFEISSSLLTDVADYQVALLNLASSDINYAFKSNYPFYVEQYDFLSDMTHLRQALKETQELDSGAEITGYAGKADQAKKAADHEINIGAAQGRRYPKGTDSPGFIHPSSEPLLASMKKQDILKQEIRQLVNLAITNIEPRRASAESKAEDVKTLEAGLSYIGLELEYGERQIAAIWNMYENHRKETDIKYPEKYSLLSETERRAEAEELRKIQTAVPSKIFQRKVAKKIIDIVVGHEVLIEDLNKMYEEIDDSVIVISDADVIIKDYEAGLVGLETASKARGYPDDEAGKAKADHIERLARIAEAQSKAGPRGVGDLDDDPSRHRKDDKK